MAAYSIYFQLSLKECNVLALLNYMILNRMHLTMRRLKFREKNSECMHVLHGLLRMNTCMQHTNYYIHYFGHFCLLLFPAVKDYPLIRSAMQF
jgi:hypothetical protein